MPLTQVSSRLIEDTLRYVLGASGTNHYTFTGKGLTGAVNDPTLTLSRGHTYIFENRNSNGAHPFYIKTSIANGGTNDAYNTGVTNNGGAGGTEIVFTVPHDAPDLLYYQCSSHSSMAGQLKIAGAVADGSITTAKIAADAVTNAKIADDAVDTAQINNNGVTNSKIVDGAVTAAKLAADAVTNAKIAASAISATELDSNAVTTAKIAADAVTNAKLADNCIATEQLANGAVTAAKLASGVGGKFLQFKYAAANSGDFSTASASGNGQDVGGMSTSITLTSSSNKVLVMISLNPYLGGTGNVRYALKLFRDSTMVFEETYVAYRDNAPKAFRSNVIYLDNPADTNAHTYKVAIKKESGSDTFYLFNEGANAHTINLFEVDPS